MERHIVWRKSSEPKDWSAFAESYHQLLFLRRPLESCFTFWVVNPDLAVNPKRFGRTLT